MSDIDRLREAADLLDGSAEEFTAVTTQSKATADLLRAMDNDAKAVFDAGLALTDAILGGTE